MIQIISIICYWSVDIFAILTGYLYFNRETIRSKRVFALLTTVIFYCVIITLIVGITTPSILQNNIKEIIESLFPPIDGFYWYITCYVFVFFMIPYLNRFLKTLTEKENFTLILLLTVLLSVIPTFGIADYFRTSKGYSPWWLIYCYIVGAYMNRVDLAEKYRRNKFVLIILGNIVIAFILWNILIPITRKFDIDKGVSKWFLEYISPFTVMSAICVVCIFSRMEIRHSLENIIKSLSAASFGVYILHCHRLIYIFFLKDAFQWIAECNFIMEIAAFLGVVCAIYIVCWIIECIRNKLFEFLNMEKVIDKVGDTVDRILMWK